MEIIVHQLSSSCLMLRILVKYLVQRWITDLHSHFQSGTTKHYILNEHTLHSWQQQQHSRHNLHPLISHVVGALQAAIKAATDQDIMYGVFSTFLKGYCEDVPDVAGCRHGAFDMIAT